MRSLMSCPHHKLRSNQIKQCRFERIRAIVRNAAERPKIIPAKSVSPANNWLGPTLADSDEFYSVNYVPFMTLMSIHLASASVPPSEVKVASAQAFPGSNPAPDTVTPPV